MGSATAASLMPSTGLVSALSRVPLYSKWKVWMEPLSSGAGSEMWTVELVVRRSELRPASEWRIRRRGSLRRRGMRAEPGPGQAHRRSQFGDPGDVEAVVQLEDGLGEVFECGEGDVGGGGEVIGGGIEVGGDDVVR